MNTNWDWGKKVSAVPNIDYDTHLVFHHIHYYCITYAYGMNRDEQWGLDQMRPISQVERPIKIMRIPEF
ncbi:MAG: hypothetical protein Q9213_005755 [Squamulea squamosa]